MRDKNKFKKQFQKKSRLEILKSWMTSFVITTAAVVVTVVAIPSSPKASINQLQIFQDQIVYQVEITDSDNAIQSNSLEIILENQFEHYAIDLDLGVNIGSFTELTEDTTYQLYVMGDKGFGNEKLASKTITTKPSSGGAILSYELLESSVHYNPIYDLGIIVRDQLNLYNLVTLYYGVIGYDETEPFEYYSFDIADGESTITLDQIYQSNAQVHVYLEATLENNEIIILDELYFYTPINFELYYSVEQVTESAIKVSFYPEFYQLSDLEYEFKLKKDGLVVSTKTFDSHDIQDETMHMDTAITFDKLKNNTLYVLEVSASFTNPHTLAKETISSGPIEVRTLNSFSYTIDIEQYDTYFEVNITLTDPFHNYQLAYYEIYEIQDDYDWFLSGESFGFTSLGESKTVSFTIDKPSIIPVKINIGLRNETTMMYYQIISGIMIIE